MIAGWLGDIEEDVRNRLCGHGAMSARELAESLGVPESCAVGYVLLLASAGRLTIERVSLPRPDQRGDGRSGGAGTAVEPARGATRAA
jgi:hypothetical protein